MSFHQDQRTVDHLRQKKQQKRQFSFLVRKLCIVSMGNRRLDVFTRKCIETATGREKDNVATLNDQR
jgi:hypothetical protein